MSSTLELKEGWHDPEIRPKPHTFFHNDKPVAAIRPVPGGWQPIAFGATHLFHAAQNTIGGPVADEEGARKIVEKWVEEAAANAQAAQEHLAKAKTPKPPPDEPVDSGKKAK